MASELPLLTRRSFGSLLVAAVPAARSADAVPTDVRAQFLRDVALSYEQQIIGVDMEDVRAVFDSVRSPVLAVGVCAGVDRATRAGESAVADAGRLGRHTLVVIATGPGEWTHREHRRAFNTVRSYSMADARLIYSPCNDPALAGGAMRVALLTG